MNFAPSWKRTRSWRNTLPKSSSSAFTGSRRKFAWWMRSWNSWKRPRKPAQGFASGLRRNRFRFCALGSNSSYASVFPGSVPERLDLVQEVYALGMRRFGRRLFELLQKLFLLPSQVLRRLDFHLHVKIARQFRSKHRHAFPAQAKLLSGLSAFGDLNARATAIDGGHLDLS